MSLITEGFEGSLLPAGWDVAHYGDVAQSITGHSGNALRLVNTEDSYGGAISSTFAATTNIVLDIMFRANYHMYLSGTPIIGLKSGTTRLLSIFCQTGSSAQFEIHQYSGSTPTLVATTTNYYAENTWHHLVLEANLIASGSATLTVNGVEEISAESGNFANGASGATKLFLGSAPFTNVDYDTLDLSAAGGGGGPSVSVRRQRFPRGLCRGLCQR